MTNIAETLKRFNRKERYWVVRNALGASAASLDARFCLALEKALSERGVSIDPGAAWWAVDYHLDWLVAALRLHCESTGADTAAVRENAANAVQGNQEDIDLILAVGQDLILVEAKIGSWSRKQLRSKLKRLALLTDDEGGLAGAGERAVRLHFLLMSPREPDNRKLGALLADAPAWMRRADGAWYWLPLLIDEPAPDCTVHRADARGRKDAGGSHWAVKVKRRKRS